MARCCTDFSRTDLWRAIGLYLDRDRRFGGAVDSPDGGMTHTPE